MSKANFEFEDKFFSYSYFGALAPKLCFYPFNGLLVVNYLLVAQVVKHLSSKPKTLSSNLLPLKKKRKKGYWSKSF
jgi:hypothetical protein